MHDTVNHGGNCPAEAGEFDSSCRERSAPSCGGFNGSCDDVIALFKAA
jgi:hypothetical protein